MAESIIRNIVNELKERAENASRTTDKGFVNDKTGGSVLIDEQGNVTIAASKTVQYKLNYSQGQATEVSMQSNTITNRKNINTDEIVVNKHKLNPQLWQLTDMKRLYADPTSGIGGLTMNATVLVKTWEPVLEKWVLIRRPVRTPIFSNLLPLPDVPNDMGINESTNISDEIKEMRDTDNLNKGW
jgi:hypothetical protein